MNHWINIACILQTPRFPSSYAAIPSCDISVATFVIIFPNAAKNASRLMGLWNAGEMQKVTMMNPAPRSEKTEPTRVVVRRISSCRVVHGILYGIYVLILQQTNGSRKVRSSRI